MALKIRVVEVAGRCPAYRPGDSIIIKNGFLVDLERTTAICMHSLAAILPYYVALNRGVSPVDLGLARKGDRAYVQCLDPCRYTGGGTVVFEIERLDDVEEGDAVMKHFAELGENCTVHDGAVVGLKYREGCRKVRIGDNAVIRSYTVIYADVVIGNDFKTGHHVVIRENTRIGNRVVVGTGTVIDGDVEIGDRVKIETRVYVPTHTKIGSDVFIGPGVVMTNDKYPQRLRDQYEPVGPVIEDSVSIGANSVILPGVRIGEGSFVAAGTVVAKNVPPWSLVMGPAGEIRDLPEKLRERNRAKRW